jgi:hypothetical protein
MDTPHFGFPVHAVAKELVVGELAVGRGSEVIYWQENGSQCGEEAALVQANGGEMEVETSGLVGRKSLRQWKRRARVPQVVNGTNCKSIKASGKRKGATRLAGEGELTKKKKNVQECVVVHAAETNMVGTAVQPC